MKRPCEFSQNALGLLCARDPCGSSGFGVQGRNPACVSGVRGDVGGRDGRLQDPAAVSAEGRHGGGSPVSGLCQQVLVEVGLRGTPSLPPGRGPGTVFCFVRVRTCHAGPSAGLQGALSGSLIRLKSA